MTENHPMTEPDPTVPPVNPPWVTKAVLGLITLVWVLAIVNIVRGEDWPETVGAAAVATLCLSAVDINLKRKRKSD